MLIGGARLSPNDENAVTMSYSFQGKQILVLEDDALLAMDMEDFLSDLGVNVVGPVSHIGAALEKINDTNLDGAVIDLNLRGELSLPVIEELKAANIPFVICSGYAEIPGVRAQLDGLTVVSKPCDFDNLSRVLANEFSLTN
jgi:DNA-binding NtrC family response regulator